MINLKHFLVLGIFFGVAACSYPTQSEFAAASTGRNLSLSQENPSEESGIPVSINIEGRLELQFRVEDLFTEPAYLQRIHHDTVYLMLGFVEKISGHQFQLENLDPNIKKIRIYQSYETSLSLMDEGPHMDLTDWLHFTSPWEPVPVKNWQFSSLEYQESQYQKFPEVNNEEILEAVRTRVTNEKWLELARDCQDPQSYPCGVSISRYFLKLEVQEAPDSVWEKVVVFEVPMGC